MTLTAADILAVTKIVTRDYTKQRKAEERGLRSRETRELMGSGRVDFTACAHDIIPAAYQHASGNGTYTVPRRQIYYAAREEFLKRTGREIKSVYFTKTLLVQYMNRHRETDTWKVTADPRGTLTIPNAGYDVRIPCGTLAIEEYLAESNVAADPFDIDAALRVQWPSLAPGQRYQAVLYIEKEGFDPMLREARIAERFDIAIISCKGQSVVAARRYVDEVCRALGGVPLFIIHDFDKAGFEIALRLTTISEWAERNDRVTYRFKNKINATDIGLRLEDVQEYNLASERSRFRGGFAPDSIATEEEQAFLRSGRRVELNAFTAPQFIEWVPAKLRAHGLTERLIPNDAVLEAACRRSLALATINAAIEGVQDRAIEEARSATLPPELRRELQAAMKGSPEAWDLAIYHLAQTKVSRPDAE